MNGTLPLMNFMTIVYIFHLMIKYLNFFMN